MNIKIIIPCLLISAMAFSQTSVSGYVFEDLNKNNKKENREKGIENVAVSNGLQVVLTDKSGRYSLPIQEDQTIFVIKPSGYKLPLNSNNLPQYYYQYKPKGSPVDFKYKGVLPTGTLPKEINFALQKQEESKNFDILVFGDPQPYTEKELDYFKRAIVKEVKETKKNAIFGISLGDLVGDNLSLQKPYADVMKEIGLPWYNVMGNHDMNYEAKEDMLSDETFESNFGPANYSFNYGNVHFMILDDILYPDPRDGKGYWGGFREDQIQFIQNDLKLVDKNKLIVVSFHIPLEHNNEDNFRNADRQILFDALSPFANALMLSAHTHIQQQIFYGKPQGWNGSKDLHEYNVGTTCGDWWSGTSDEIGLPTSTMRDGTAKGYSFISFNDNQYKVKYKTAGKPEDYQIKLYLPKVIPFPSKTSAKVVANFFIGSKKDKVEYRIDGGKWEEMEYNETIDPNFAQSVFKWDTTQDLFPGRRPSNPDLSKHIWVGGFGNKLTLGKHKVEVRASDMYGNQFTASENFEVKDRILIP
ncbi:calcineurin-like phosphoesterase C-terminal domain-containing protein [Chryseobacterium aquaticum]|uniref:Metallophosphoesterase n=1 Tax=Chryseobacterium aquaticum subsp. greenlandense TaxID=345663 RepID=A0A124F2Z2_9FLAO|nr:calcineurin-like phosphoesterase C-terminal domain-containing protein [Chryseobacterium aquaticum]KUJ56306.1 metallophosphoesterase [Chryseobacterium aquaticum subsp. greenlandense]